MNEGWLLVSEARSHIASHAEVWVLVDRLRDQAQHVLGSSKGHREGAGEGRGSLNSWEANLSNVGLVIEAKHANGLAEGHALANLANIGVHVADVVQIAKDKGLCLIESACNDVLGIFASELVALFQFHVLEVELFVIRELNHQRYVKRLLQIAREVERDQVTQVQGRR